MTDFVQKEIKNKETVLYFDYEEFQMLDDVVGKFDRVLSKDSRYSILVRVAHISMGSSSEYKMLGPQYNFSIGSKEDFVKLLQDFHKSVTERLVNSMDIYHYENSDVLNLQFLVYSVGNFSSSKPTKFSTKELGDKTDLFNVTKTKDGFNNYIPLLPNDKDYGINLSKNIEDNRVVSVNLTDNSEFDLAESINKYRSTRDKVSISGECQIYQKKINEVNYIITVDTTGIYKFISIYHLNGMLVHKIVDSVLEGDVRVRQIGNVKSYINEKGIYKKEITLNFSPVHSYKVGGKLGRMIHPEWRFGTMDLETYNHQDIAKTYAIGFHTKDNTQMFYLDKSQDSDELIWQCLDAMLIEKYNGYTFYIHNFGRFDVYFLYKAIIRANLFDHKYDHEPVYRDNLMLSLKISIKKNKKVYSIKFVDSYNLLQASLAKLCKTFGTEVSKSFFPYDFVNKNTLYYEGKKPEISFFKRHNFDTATKVLDINGKSKMEFYEYIDSNSYNNIPSVGWSMKEETLIYLKNDLVSLYNVMDKFISQIYIHYNTHLTKSLTISSLSMDIFLKKYYNNNIPLIKQKSVYNDIKKSYYGGITEVYKPYGKNLYYYDVNSLYPHAALNIMPGLGCVYSDNINSNMGSMKDKIFGFYYCSIEATEHYLGLLPFRDKNGLIMPVGKYEGWYFSEELKYAYENGYKIHIHSGYTFDKSVDVFKKYVTALYKIKCTTKDTTERAIVKSLLNNLLGRFGLDINRYTTSLLSRDELENVLQTRKIKSIKYIDDKCLVNHSADISKEVCEENGLNYKEIFNEASKSNTSITFKEDDYHDVSVAISSAVTSYARIFINKAKLDVLKKGGSIYYTDTDSIVTDIELDESLVGNDLGQFKLEHKIKEGYFISNKTYGFTTLDDKIIIKNKGVFGKSLTLDDFKDLYSGKNVEAIRLESRKDYSKGSVTLFNQSPIVLSSNSYNKRTKVFSSDNKWIDTKPIKYNNYHTQVSSITNVTQKVVGYVIKAKSVISYMLLWLLIVTLYLVHYLLNDDLESSHHFNEEKTDTCSKIVYEKVEKNDRSFNSITTSESEKWTQKVYDLFKWDSKIVYTTPNFDRTNESSELSTTSKNEVKDLGILGAVKDHHLNSCQTEIEELKNKVSLLEWHLINHRIDKLDNARLFDELIKDIKQFEHDHKLKFESPKLDQVSLLVGKSPKSWGSPNHKRFDSKFD